MERTDEEEEADCTAGPDATSARVRMKNKRQPKKIDMVINAAMRSKYIRSNLSMIILLWLIVLGCNRRAVGGPGMPGNPGYG